jgi:glycosyltransferase involved in cell wall biosynthesis
MIKYLPKISIITPSLNQAEFLEKTILSILNQNYPNLEYIIIDGGSSDGSVEIIKKYQDQISYWISEIDNGQSYAINKGLRKATGEWVGWQNSDDIYHSGAFYNLALVAKNNPNTDVILGDMTLINQEGIIMRECLSSTPTYNAVLAEGSILFNQSCFWKKKLHEDIGFLNEAYQYCFDREWFLRVLKYTKAKHVSFAFGALRVHSKSKSTLMNKFFEKEHDMIMHKRNLSSYKIFFYQIRRAYLIILNGRIDYVIKGIFNRILKKIKKIFAFFLM